MKTAFIELMTDHWENTLGLASSAPLQQGWRQLETACMETSSGQSPWQVLQLPTGSGKTEALKAICASYGREGRTGILVVTRFRNAADDLAAGINALAGDNIAISQHSGNTVKFNKWSNMPVLIITHSAYKNALSEAASCETSPQLDRYRQYVHTDRRMVVVDEAFEWVESFTINLSELQAFCGALSGVPGLDANFALAGLAEFAHQTLELANSESSDKQLSSELLTKLQALRLADLRTTVSQLTRCQLEIWDTVDKPDNALRAAYMSLLAELEKFQQLGQAWLSNRGARCQLNGSRLLMDLTRSNGVILDATAEVDVSYCLLGHRVQLLRRPVGIRTYRNVVMNLSTGHRVGKQHLSEHGAKAWSSVRAALDRRLVANDEVLICCHKDVKPSLSVSGINCRSISTAHWGDLDGKNNWHNFGVGVIFGMPFLDDIAPTNAVLACQPHLGRTWFDGSRCFGKHSDIGQAFKDGFVAKSVVQALNRIRCRKPTDANGECMTTELFMLLDNSRTASVVVAAIQSQMPGIELRDWESATVAVPKKLSPSHAKLLVLLSTAAPGKHVKSSIVAGLGIASRTFERMSPAIQEPSSPLARELTALGVRYHCGTGRGKEAYFMKS